MITPQQVARSGTEFAEQTALFQWCALNVGKYPDLKWYYAIKNEEKSGSVIRGNRSRISGTKKGVSDTCLPVKRGAYSGLYLELKRLSLKPKKKGRGGVSDEQLEFGAFVQSQGFGFVVCYGWEEAAKILVQYLEQK